ncbi:unnamed protein product [Prorocentrum cordatum]|uniref:Uncharacterized protein n=1 Tax=Prorocentrum cordatum TaxID=2364126 RepID=A0ABN9S9Y4_9DINO|nr:unnamed protein product [Polarella glacialis]
MHERIVEAAGSVPKYRITDKTCTPDLSQPCHTQYVDNFIAISSDADHVKKSAAAAIAALEARGVGVSLLLLNVYGVLGLLFALFSLAVGQKVGASKGGAGVGGAPSGALVAPLVAGLGTPLLRGAIEQDWKVVGRFEWRKKGESIPVLEARATLCGYRHLLRNCQHHGKRLVVLGDSMSVAGAVSRSRSKSRAMMSVTQSIAALSLATGSSLHYRWLPSEWNAVRGRWHPAAPTALAARDARTRSAGSGRRGLAQPGGADRAAAQDSPGGVEGALCTSSAPWRRDGRCLEPACVVGAQPRSCAAPAAAGAAAAGRLACPSGLERTAAPRGMAVLSAASIQRRPRNRYHEIARNFLARSRGRPLTSEDQADAAIAVHAVAAAVEPLTFALYLRPEEALHIRAEDLGAPVSGVGTLAAATKDFNIDVEARGVHAALGGALVHMLRHGGASHDFASGRRRLVVARQRGRWLSWPAGRRYVKGSRFTRGVLMPTSARQARRKLCVELLSARVFVEVFSGGGHLSDAISGVGEAALLWDICLGENYDLRCKRNRHLLLGWVRDGLVVGPHVATPRSSFSRARDTPPGPPRLRSDSEPMGLGGLSQADQEKLAGARCAGSKRGICSRTGRGHQQLQGKDPAGQFYTKLAEPCPKVLCKAIATACYNSWAKGIGDSFERSMQ